MPTASCKQPTPAMSGCHQVLKQGQPIKASSWGQAAGRLLAMPHRTMTSEAIRQACFPVLKQEETIIVPR